MSTTTSQESPRRDCRHPRARHRHGTRAAYVADRCRCDLCREANRVAGRDRSRAIAYGRWTPYVDATGVRAHVERLRANGIGVDRIIALSGVGSGTLRHLIFGDSRTGSPVYRVRQDTAARLLSVPATSGSHAPHALVDAADTHRYLHALIDAGWSIPALATELPRTPASLRATLQRARVTADTASRVRALHQQIAGAAAVAGVRAHAERLPPHGQVSAGENDPSRAANEATADDNDNADPLPAGTFTDDPGDLDDVAVERAMHGEHLP